IVRQKQQIRALDTLISINEERVALADRKLSVGLGSRPELLQARADLNAQVAQRPSQETAIAQAREELNRLMGSRPGLEYDVSDSIPINLSLAYDSLSRDLHQVNPGLLSLSKSVDLAALALKERKADLWPRLRLVSGYNFGRTS